MTAEKETIAPTSRRRWDTAVLLALLPVVAAALRIWLYSAGELSVFLTVMRTLNIPAVLIGTAAALVPVVITVVVLQLIMDRDLRARASKRWKSAPASPWLGIASGVVFLLILYTTPWTVFALLGGALVIAIGFGLVRRWILARRKGTSRIRERVGPDSAVVLTVVIIGALITPTQMWLPLERVEIGSVGQRDAYVLESSSDWTTMITNTRDLIVVSSSDVQSRAICRANPGTLAALVHPSDDPDAPDCKKATR